MIKGRVLNRTFKEVSEVEHTVYPRGVDSARAIQVIETKSARGSGEPGQPSRIVTEYWTMDGKKLAEIDPVKPAS